MKQQVKTTFTRRLAKFLQQQRRNDDTNADTDGYNAENEKSGEDQHLPMNNDINKV